MNDDLTGTLLDAILPRVAFEGWSGAAFDAAVRDAGADPVMAEAACPRGAVDLALAFHERGDAAMLAKLDAADLPGMRVRERVAAAVRWRLEACGDREPVLKAMALFARPDLAPDGAAAIWRTCDRIWTALGDESDDVNWYTKRAILCGVYSATALYWVGDDSPGCAASWAFLDRRIENVMQFEKLKARARKSRAFAQLERGPLSFLGRIRRPDDSWRARMPGGRAGAQ